MKFSTFLCVDPVQPPFLVRLSPAFHSTAFAALILGFSAYGQSAADQSPADQAAAAPAKAENRAETEPRAETRAEPRAETRAESGIPFRFSGATYRVDGAADASYLYRFAHQRVPTAEAAPQVLDQKFITHVFHLDLGLAVTNRPWRNGQFSVGLRYQQDWAASHRAMTDYLADVTDFDNFPWTAKVLETDRQFYGWYRHELTPSTFVNLYGAYRVRHEGALQLTLQEGRNDGDNAPRLRSIKWLPSLTVMTEGYGTFLPYLYYVRQQNYADSGLSFETYSRESTLGVSFGLRHVLPFGQGLTASTSPSKGGQTRVSGFQLMTELYRHSYTFNQFYHDFDRTGLVARLDGRLTLAGAAFGAGGIVAFSQDRFRHSQIVVNSCTFPDGSASSDQTVACDRQDRNLYGGFWAHYRQTPKHIWSFRYSVQSVESNLGRHHRFNEYQYIVGYQYNFDRFHGSQTFTDTQLDRIYGKKAYTYD